MKKWMFLCLCFYLMCPLAAQKADWSLSLNHFFNNTEFQGSSFHRPQTMTGVWLKPAVSLDLDSFSRLNAGVDLLKEYGSLLWVDDVVFVSYFEHQRDYLTFHAGSFPRAHATSSFSRFFFRDSISYFRPFMTGLWLHTGNSRAEAEVFLDWTGKKSGAEHEAFFIGASGFYSGGLYYASMQALLRHHAASQLVRGVQESALGQLALGLDMTRFSVLDTLTLQAAWLVGFERDRTCTALWTMSNGLSAELKMSWKQVSLNSTWYVGEGMMPEYDRLGSTIYWGDAFYAGKMYGRTDLMVDFFRSDRLKLRVVMSHHFSEKQHFFEQAMVGSIFIDDIRLKN